MGTKRKSPLRQAVRTAAGIVLLFASLIEVVSVLAEYGAGPGGSVHLIFAALSAVGALIVFFNIGYSAYIVLPFALGIFFYEIYRTASAAISLYTVVSGISFLVAALLCFMLIRAHKV
jgi:hypothetical protein